MVLITFLFSYWNDFIWILSEYFYELFFIFKYLFPFYIVSEEDDNIYSYKVLSV